MENKACLIITSINSSENSVLKNYAKLCSEKSVGFILAGDTKSPSNFDLPGCEFLSIEVQKKLPFTLSKLLPDRNYAKKNLAYLSAIQKGYAVLIETDDDNLPMDDFWNSRHSNIDGDFLINKSWVNIYKYFSEANIWPRGFPLNKIKDKVQVIEEGKTKNLFCPIQQGLVDENPDVDAIYRLTSELPHDFKKREPVILGSESFCPFNSQNTTWFKEAFPLLYLPSYCSFRMTDIWRSFIAQRILWTCDWNLAFHSSNVFQKRNDHNLLKDLEDEIQGYLHCELFMDTLRNVEMKKGVEYISENLILSYKALIEKNLMDKRELDLLEAWVSDLGKLK